MIRLEILILLFVTVTIVTALDPPDNFRERTCSQVSIKPVTASREFVDSLKYISGGSKYHLFRMASGLGASSYGALREDQFYYEACYSRNTSTTGDNSISAVFGFDRLLSTFMVSSRSGIYFEASPRDPAQSANTVTATITLTDNKTFAVWVNCWNQINQAGWGLVTLNGRIDSKSRRAIEIHASGLGFRRENFIFLNYDGCRQNCSSCHGSNAQKK